MIEHYKRKSYTEFPSTLRENKHRLHTFTFSETKFFEQVGIKMVLTKFHTTEHSFLQKTFMQFSINPRPHLRYKIFGVLHLHDRKDHCALSHSKLALHKILTSNLGFKLLGEALNTNQREKLSYGTIFTETICIRTHQ